MMEYPITTVNIHGSPKVANFNPDTCAVCISTSAPYYTGSGVTFFCGDGVLAHALAVAINAAIEAHAQREAPVQEAAE